MLNDEIKEHNILWYKKTYDSLITKCLSTNYDPSIYLEVHHIVPKCMGGTNEKSNLVSMTTREHIIAHMLLARIYPDEYKLIFAVNCILDTRNFSEKGLRISSRTIARFREENRKALSETRKGENNPNYGNHHSEESRKLMSLKQKGEKHWLFGKNHKEETKIKISNSLKGENNPNYGIKFTKEHRENISKARIGKFTGENNSFYGKTHTESSKEIISKKALDRAPKLIDKEGNILPAREMARLYNISRSTLSYWIHNCPNKGITYYNKNN